MTNKVKEAPMLEWKVIPDQYMHTGVDYPLLLPPPKEELSIDDHVQQILDRAKQFGLDNPLFAPWHLGEYPVFSGTVVVPDAENDWAVVPLVEDPWWTESDMLFLPKKPLKHLKKLWRVGLDFDAIYIAHEIPKDTLCTGDPLPKELVIPPTPPSIVKKAAQIGLLSRITWMGTLVSALPSVAIFHAAAKVVEELDPILFGLKFQSKDQSNTRELAEWFYLCHFSW